MIKVNAPYITEDEINAVIEVLKSGQLAHGPVVEEFEKAFSEYLGVPYTVAVSNGTVALYLALKALGIGEGDEVIVPDFTFIATASMVVAAGAKPVFADIDLRTYTIDPEDVKKKITKRTKAMIVVHLYGHPANMGELMDIAKEHNLYLIEDCAQSHGAEFRGIKTGSFGDVAAFSFYATKNLTMGEGGAVVTKSKEVAEKVKLLRNHGQISRYYHEVIGWNFRLTSIQAAIGLQQLRKL
ncbi:MAG: aminotransferase DegT, partial [Thermoprotei archaeon]